MKKDKKKTAIKEEFWVSKRRYYSLVLLTIILGTISYAVKAKCVDQRFFTGVFHWSVCLGMDQTINAVYTVLNLVTIILMAILIVLSVIYLKTEK